MPWHTLDDGLLVLQDSKIAIVLVDVPSFPPGQYDAQNGM